MTGSSSSPPPPPHASMGSSSFWSAPTTFGSTISSSSSLFAAELRPGSLPAATCGPSFGFGFSPYPAQPTSSPFSVPFGSTRGACAPPFGMSCTDYSPFSIGRVSQEGSRIYGYTQTADNENPNCHLQSISAMSAYKNKSHEELRHEDYQRGCKGTGTSGPILQVPVSTSAVPANLTGSSQRDFSSAPATVDQPFAQLQSSTGGSSTANPFWHASAGSESLFSLARLKSSIPEHVPVSTFAVPANLTSSSQRDFSTTPVDQPFARLQSSTGGSSTANPFWQASTAHGETIFGASCTSHGGTLFGACTVPSTTSAIRPTTTPLAPSSVFSSTQHRVPLTTSSAWPTTTSFAPSSVLSSTQHRVPTTTSSTRPASFDPSSFASSTRHGVNVFQPCRHGVNVFNPCYSSSLPASAGSACVGDVDEPNDTIDLVVPNNIRLVRIRFSSGNNGTESLASKVHFLGLHDDNSSATSVRSGCNKLRNSAACPPSSGINEIQKGNSSDVHRTQRSPLAAPFCNVVTESVLPRLYNADYYTMPSIVELAYRESDEPGYCSRVKDFTVGRHGYGSVKFHGESDVRKLDIASIVEFNEREILVYRDERNMPPAGQELNKPADVTLLKLKCVDEKTGFQFTAGPAVDRYKETLVQWTKEHDAEFVSFDAVKGEWKFRVKNFNM